MGRRPTPHSTGETTDPSKVPLPKTPTKTAEDSRGRKAPTAVFSATGERSPYFQDSHMVTPSLSTALSTFVPPPTTRERQGARIGARDEVPDDVSSSATTRRMMTTTRTNLRATEELK
ncbi:unnamed protein product [Phytophthora lilii]|uniref:Unnamed protein product n=1 Tax=Phytophthora lilii TaxID=2077276 RepID=A0A9W6U8F8_9STRA|nr:unnamed protein product [Phytophthora lilii]